MRFHSALTEGSLASLAAQYVYVHIDLNKKRAEANAWHKKFSPQAKGGIPQVHIVRWDGKTLHDKIGAVSNQQLTEYLKPENAGVSLGEAQLSKAKQVGDQAEKFLEEGKTAEAVAVLSKYLRSKDAAVWKATPPAFGESRRRFLDSPSGEAIDRIDEIGAKFITQAKADIKTGSEQLESKDEAVDGALRVLGALQSFSKLPTIGKQLAVEVNLLRRKSGIFFRRAESILKAQAFVKNDRKSSAIILYKSLAKRYPRSRTAEIANKALVNLGEEAVAAPSRPAVATGPTKDAADHSGEKPTASSVSAADIAKATTLYERARLLSRSSPSLAKTYARRVIKLAPGSEIAARAEKLIARL